jgi:iron-sulfur cluster insertion protein
MIHLTEKAAKKIKEISDDEGVGHYVLRLKILGSGCAGFSSDIYFDELISNADEVYELDGVKLIVDEMSMQYLDESTVDFKDGEFESGFKVINPNTTGSCGCGSSFSV